MQEQKTILITGATAGIGEAAAQKFAKAGWKLILTGRRKERLKKIKASLGVPVHILVQDIRDLKQVQKDLKELPSDFANIDVLLNNAGLALGLEKAQEASLDNWMQMIDTNIKGLVDYTHILLPKMIKRKKGHIINISSVAGYVSYPSGNVYCGTKAFVSQFTKCLNADLVGTGIRTTFIEPWKVDTEFSLVRFKGDKKRADKEYRNYKPLKAEDIAETIFWAAIQPEHVNISRIEVSSIDQSYGSLNISKTNA